MIKGRLKGGIFSTDIKGFERVFAIGEADAEGRVECLAVFDTDQGGMIEQNGVFIDLASRITLARGRLGQQAMALNPDDTDGLRRKALLREVARYFEAVHRPAMEKPFTPGVSRVNYAGRVYDEREMVNLVDASLEFYLTAGRYDRAFRERLETFLASPDAPRPKALTVNSGSSANLIAVSALTSPKLGDLRLKRGDEVVTVATGFPTSIAPIIQNGLTPVFVDIEPGTLNIDARKIEDSLSENTRAIVLAHTLGMPFDLDTVLEVAEKHRLWVVEDNCDCLGATYTLKRQYNLLKNKNISGTARTGTFGHLGTSSFYPAHQITMGEGGAVYSTDMDLYRIALSLRDWGRDCWCEPGRDNTCENRFNRQLGLLPRGYDHKYTYSHIGYNLKVTDMQAAVGLAQMDRLGEFVDRRFRNWQRLRQGFQGLADVFQLPAHPTNAQPSPFGFFLTLKNGLPFSREDITQYLESKHIQTRTVFAGNMLRQPAFTDADAPLRVADGKLIRSGAITGDSFAALPVTETVMANTFWIGVYPGLRPEMIEYMIDTIHAFVRA